MCSLAPMDCLNEGECLKEAGASGDVTAFTRAKPRDPSSTERQHFEGPDDERLIAHQATPGIVEVLKEQFGLEPISRESYYEAESEEMDATSDEEGPAEGKA